MRQKNDILSKVSDLRQFIIDWNNSFPYDRVYRRKYGIAFMSEEHLNVCQIDVYLDILEDKMYSDFVAEHEYQQEKNINYEKGILFSEIEEDDELVSQLFDKIDVDEINKMNSNEDG